MLVTYYQKGVKLGSFNHQIKGTFTYVYIGFPQDKMNMWIRLRRLETKLHIYRASG